MYLKAFYFESSDVWYFGNKESFFSLMLTSHLRFGRSPRFISNVNKEILCSINRERTLFSHLKVKWSNVIGNLFWEAHKNIFQVLSPQRNRNFNVICHKEIAQNREIEICTQKRHLTIFLKRKVKVLQNHRNQKFHQWKILSASFKLAYKSFFCSVTRLPVPIESMSQ